MKGILAINLAECMSYMYIMVVQKKKSFYNQEKFNEQIKIF